MMMAKRSKGSAEAGAHSIEPIADEEQRNN